MKFWPGNTQWKVPSKILPKTPYLCTTLAARGYTRAYVRNNLKLKDV